ncbi:MAG: hypothetical protein HYV29_05885 [Ignavibacteriales bacterium]|nr:hypothetical protein [Ignavibacteriales bacterium]
MAKKIQILIACLLLSCSHQPTQTENPVKEDISSYFPLNIGNRWVYSYGANDGPLIIMRSIDTILNLDNGGRLYGFVDSLSTFDSLINGDVRGFYTYNNGRFYFYRSLSDTTNIMIPFLQSPIKVGFKWTWNSKDANGSREICSIYLDTFNGVTDTVVLVVHTSSGGILPTDYSIDSVWYMKGIGMIKEVSESHSFGVHYTRYELLQCAIQ